MRIDPRRTFRMVIEGSPNRDALALARRVAARSGPRPNPLLIRGQTGTGKTLLLHATANELARRRGPLAIATFTAEEFWNAYLDAIRGGWIPAFRDRMDRADVLVVDELEDLETKPDTFQELLRAIRVAVERDKPVLLATGPTWNEALDRTIRESPHGAAAVLAPSTQKQRMIALHKTCSARRRRVPRVVLRTIARRAPTIAAARAELERLLIERAGVSASARARRPSFRAS